MIKELEQQHIYYQPGLGTRAGPGFSLPVTNWVARIAGLAFGYGIRDDIRDAYVFIMNNWRPGDRLYLFGFSRGAYTVRALAGLIHMYGIAMPGNEALNGPRSYRRLYVRPCQHANSWLDVKRDGCVDRLIGLGCTRG